MPRINYTPCAASKRLAVRAGGYHPAPRAGYNHPAPKAGGFHPAPDSRSAIG